jgi:hypothetical protein
MATIMPYVPQNPGDLITAENWNEMQVKIQQDILDKMKKAEDDVKAGTVAKAQDAATVDGKTVTDLTADFDVRYAFKVHDHEGVAAYRRYFKEFMSSPSRLLDAFLRHGLHRFTIVDTYAMDDVVRKQPASDKEDYKGCKFLFFRKHQDADAYGLYVSSGRDNELVGISFDELIREYDVEVKDDDSIEDAIGDFWDEFTKEPNDKIHYCQTPWVKECCDKSRTVGDLKRSGDWPDLYIAMRPVKCEIDPTGETMLWPCLAEVDQVSYDTLYVRVTENFVKSQVNSIAVLMFLLRS